MSFIEEHQYSQAEILQRIGEQLGQHFGPVTKVDRSNPDGYIRFECAGARYLVTPVGNVYEVIELPSVLIWRHSASSVAVEVDLGLKRRRLPAA